MPFKKKSTSSIIDQGLFSKTNHKHTLVHSATNSQDDDNNDSLVQEPTQKKHRAAPLNKTENFKLKTEKSFWWVPREKYIREQLATFIAPVSQTQYLIESYKGEYESNNPHRASIYEQLCDVAILLIDEQIPAMKNGHVMKRHTIHRGLVMQLKGTDEVLGGIYFKIDLNTRVCTIPAVQIDDEYHGQKLGSYLTHCAIFIALLYGCEKIHVWSVSSARGFYRKNGFTCEDGIDEEAVSSSDADMAADFDLDFLDGPSTQKFLACVARWNNTNIMQNLITKIRENAQTLAQNKNTISNMISSAMSFRPEGNDFPFMAFLASYANRTIATQSEENGSETSSINTTSNHHSVSTAQTLSFPSSGPSVPEKDDENSWWEGFNF